MKILSIIGDRSQFVKEAVIQNEINKFGDIDNIKEHISSFRANEELEYLENKNFRDLR